MASSSKKAYVRGPYNKTGIYRTKITDSKEDICTPELTEKLRCFRLEIKSEFQISKNRSEVLENLQSLTVLRNRKRERKKQKKEFKKIN